MKSVASVVRGASLKGGEVAARFPLGAALVCASLLAAAGALTPAPSHAQNLTQQQREARARIEARDRALQRRQGETEEESEGLEEGEGGAEIEIVIRDPGPEGSGESEAAGQSGEESAEGELGQGETGQGEGETGEGEERELLVEETPAPAPPPARNFETDPVAAARERIQATCLNIEYPQNFVRRPDLNGDGREDVVITYDVICDGFHSMFCGEAGCEGDVFLAEPNGGYVRVNLPPTIETTLWNGLPAVRVLRRGSACPLGDCELVLVWDGARFSRPSRALAERAREGGAAGVGAAIGDETLAGLARDALSGLGVEGQGEAGQGQRGSGQRGSGQGGSGQGGSGQGGSSGGSGQGGGSEVLRGLVDAPEPFAEFDEETSALLSVGARGDQWFLSRVLRPGRLTAAALGPDGRSAVMVSCGPGDTRVEIAIMPTEGAALRLPVDGGRPITIDSSMGSSVVDTSAAVYDVESGVWRMTTRPGGDMLLGLRDGTEALFVETGRGVEIGRFTLDGSRQAINALLRACGFS